MIIKNMQDFGKAVDDDETIQTQTHGGGYKDWYWRNLEASEVEDAVNHGCLRTKPRITYYRVYIASDGSLEVECSEFPLAEWPENDHGCTHIHDFEIEED